MGASLRSPLEAVLLGAAAPEFRCMQNRTLGFWAKSFGRWKALLKQQAGLESGQGHEASETAPGSLGSLLRLAVGADLPGLHPPALP